MLEKDTPLMVLEEGDRWLPSANKCVLKHLLCAAPFTNVHVQVSALDGRGSQLRPAQRVRRRRRDPRQHGSRLLQRHCAGQTVFGNGARLLQSGGRAKHGPAAGGGQLIVISTPFYTNQEL
jgi:hypothetical protein